MATANIVWINGEPHSHGSARQYYAQIAQDCPTASRNGAGQGLTQDQPKAAPKRIRQSSKPLLNKLETEFLSVLIGKYPGVTIHPQAWRVKIANGAWFKVDFCAYVPPKWMAWEVKGNKGKNIDRGKLALKCAAGLWPEVAWVLVWKQDGEWCEQTILP